MRPPWKSAIALFLTATLSAQLPRVDETIEVTVVNIEVVVTDRSGNRVRGLTPADFEVRDNGKLQRISNFAEYSRDGGAPVSSPAPQKPPVRTPALQPKREKRTILLFVERFTMPPAAVENFFGRLKSLLHSTIGPGDEAAIVSWYRVMKVQQDFTSDLKALDAALDRLQATFSRVDLDPDSERIRNTFMQEMMDADAEAAGFTPAPSAIFSGYEQARRELVDMRRKVFALNSLIDTMAAAEGRRVLLMATHRFSQYAGAEYFGGQVPWHYRDELDTAPLRNSVADRANAAGVTVYPIYPEGLVSFPFASVEQGIRQNIYAVNPAADQQRLAGANAILLNETTALEELAKETGGVSGWGASDIKKVVEAVRGDIGAYYSIGFRSNEARAGQPHKIAVTVKNRAYTVRTRREYIEKTDTMRMTDRVVASLFRPVPAMKLPFDLELGSVVRKGRRRHIPVTVRIPMSGLTTVPSENGRTGAFRVYGATGGLLGAMSDVFEKTQSFTVPKGQDVSGQYLTYTLELVADGRADRVSIAVFDELSKEFGLIKATVPK